MDLGLDGKCAIVTGGTRGIGLEIARTLVDEGAQVAICARRAEGVVAAVAELGDAAWGEAVDVADLDGYEAWIGRAVEHLGGLDIFVGNVAALIDADDETLWKTAFDVDLMHAVRGCRAAMPSLAASDSGSVVLISSVSGVMADPSPYGAMKAALSAYSSQLAQTAAVDGVRVNAVSPGPILFEGGVWTRHVSTIPPRSRSLRSCLRSDGWGGPKRWLGRSPSSQARHQASRPVPTSESTAGP